MKIEGKKILITGAASGIGLALAKELARAGALLALTSRSEERLTRAFKEIVTEFPRVQTPITMICDVTNDESVAQVIESCAKLLGDIDILINNAGIGVYGVAERTSMEEHRSVMEVNFYGAAYCTLLVLPYMKKKGKGLIVNIASLAAIHGVPYLSAYSASKAALVAFSQSLRSELPKEHISIMIVYPGYTQTDFFKNERLVGGARRPSGRYAPAERVAKSIVEAIELDRQDVVLTVEGKMLRISEKLMPKLVDRVMHRIAMRLQVKEELDHE
jgi:short-subunit dehydrogenase